MTELHVSNRGISPEQLCPLCAIGLCCPEVEAGGVCPGPDHRYNPLVVLEQTRCLEADLRKAARALKIDDGEGTGRIPLEEIEQRLQRLVERHENTQKELAEAKAKLGGDHGP